MSVSVLVTKSLVFGSANKRPGMNNPEWSDPDVNEQLLFAYDKQDGTHLRTIRLPGMGSGAPMTYLHDGKQYIVIAVGGADTAELVALALPD